MPVKNHRPGLVRTHSRSSSGGSRAALNLQITQKDPIQPKTEKSAKRPGHAYETGTRSASRTGSALRVQSKEHVANLPPRRAPTPHANRPAAGAGGKQKPGFTLASPGSDDEDEWVSSESGAATPNRPDDGSDESESVTTPQERHRQPAFVADDVAAVPTTPRAEHAALPPPRAPTNGMSKHARTGSASRITPTASQSSDRTPRTPDRPLEPAAAIPPSPASTQPTTSPPPRPGPPAKRPSLARAHSAHSSVTTSSRAAEHAHALRPHPLIRGQTFGRGHLAPLTVTSSAAQAELSSSPSPPSARPARLSPSPTSTVGSSLRRPSTSSVRSAATVPVGPNTHTKPGRALTHDRTRTLSTISASSSSAALSSLAHLPTATRATPTQMMVYFPQPNPHVHPESVHPLLPPPYIAPHLTVLAWRDPINESYEKVVRAKLGKRAG